MRLTSFTDYALRLLILAASRPAERLTIAETAAYFDISAAHLKKVVRLLVHAGFLTSTIGRRGGVELARAPDQINIAEVVQATEPDFGLFECYLSGNACRISRPCRLPTITNEALAAFLAVLAKYTLADVLIRPEALAGLVRSPQPLRGPKPA